MKKLLFIAAVLAGAFCAPAHAGNPTPLTVQIDRSQNPSPICFNRLTSASGCQTVIGYVNSANVWTPLGPGSVPFPPSFSIDTTNASNITSGTLACPRLPARTGDVSAPAGSCVHTLATVNSNVGTYGDAGNTVTVTVNAKGLVTAVSTQSIQAPAGQLTGSALAVGVTQSSLTKVGTITAGTWQGTPLDGAYLAVGAAATNVGTLGGDLAGSTLPNPTISAGAVTATKLGTGAAASNVGTLGGDLSGSTLPNPTIAAGAVTTSKIATNAVGNAQLAQMPASTIKGNATGATANAADLTATQATGILNAFVGDSGSGGTKGLVPAPAAGDAAAGKFLSAAGNFAVPTAVTAPRSTVRQTVQGGPQASGVPTFLPATSASLTLTAQNVSAGTSLTVAAAQGFNATGDLNYVSQLTSNPSWTLAANATNFLFINAQTGATGFTTLAPIYQFGGTISTVNSQFTFDYQGMVGYLGNGTTAVPTPLVAVGEAVTNASTVTSTAAYAYNGYFESPWTTTVPAINTSTPVTTNLGTTEATASLQGQFIAAANGYAIGESVILATTNSAGATTQVPLPLTRTGLNYVLGNSALYYVSKSSPGTIVSLASGTSATIKFKVVVKRNF